GPQRLPRLQTCPSSRPIERVLSRLARARELLRLRLTRRGVTLSTGLLVLLLAEKATLATVPGAWVERTGKAALVSWLARAKALGHFLFCGWSAPIPTEQAAK